MPLPLHIQKFVDNIYAQDLPIPNSIQEHREQWSLTLNNLDRKLTEVNAIHDIAISEHIQIRVYTPSGQGPFPLLVYYPGGAFVYSELDSHDPICRKFCKETNCVVVNVKTRVAPECPFPHGLNDAYEAFKWCVNNAEKINSLPESVIIAGDSSGANFAALVAIRAAKQNLPNIKGQILIVPATDLARTGTSHKT